MASASKESSDVTEVKSVKPSPRKRPKGMPKKVCGVCTFINAAIRSTCEMCDSKLDAKSVQFTSNQGWPCAACTFVNTDPNGTKCTMCMTERKDKD